MERTEEIKKKLADLIKRVEELKKDLDQLNNVLLYSGVLDPEKKQEIPPIVLKQPPEAVVPPAPKIIIPPTPNPEPKKEIPILQQVKAPDFREKISAPAPKKPAAPGFFERNKDIEKFIGERLITFIGIGILVVGIAFFVKYAIDKEWINEIGRTSIGILAGGILIGIAHRMRNSFRVFSSVLAGGGIASLYFTITYSFQVYQLFQQEYAFAILVVITLFTVLLSVFYNRMELAILAILGGYGTPLMVSTGDGNFHVLCSYMLILNFGMLLLSAFKKWQAVNLLSFVFTILLFFAALVSIENKQDPPYVGALIYATLYYFSFFLMNIWQNLKQKIPFKFWEFGQLLSISLLYYSAGYYILNEMGLEQYQGLFTLLVALFNFGFAFTFFKRQGTDRNLLYLLIGLVLSFISLAAPVQLDGNHITLFWASEAVLLLWLAQRSGIELIRLGAVIVNALMLGSLLINIGNTYGSDVPDMTILFNKGFMTILSVVVSLLLSLYLVRKENKKDFLYGFESAWFMQAAGMTALVFGYFMFFLEIGYQMDSYYFSDEEITIAISTWSTFFALSLLMIAWRKASRLLTVTAALMGFILLILYPATPHIATVEVRNAGLISNETARLSVFYIHFLNTAMIGYLLFVLRKPLFGFLQLAKAGYPYYLWTAAFLGVFILSSEIDHIGVLIGYDGNAESILYSVIVSQKVAYPIAWGICSFCLVAVGLQRQKRLLRVIGLVLFGITLIKLISLGFYSESQAGKIIAFIISGVVLLVVSFMYQKLKKILMEDEKNLTSEKNDKKIP